MSDPDPDLRINDLRENLSDVRARIAAAESAAGRSSGAVELIVITKTWPASDVKLLAELGVVEVGENRDQEAARKAQECDGLALTWHMVGQLQRNKARSVARWADVVHSVDRPELVEALASAAALRDQPLGVLLQVSLDGEPGRGGTPASEVARLADQVAAAPSLALLGVMAVAPLGAQAAPAFERLATLSGVLVGDHPDATWISAGMSGDLEEAVMHGATHVRVGSAVLGPRPRVG